MRITHTALHLSNHPSISFSCNSKPPPCISLPLRLCLAHFFLSFTITIKMIPPSLTASSLSICHAHIPPSYIHRLFLICSASLSSSSTCTLTHLYFFIYIHLPQLLRCFSFAPSFDLSVSLYSTSSGGLLMSAGERRRAAAIAITGSVFCEGFQRESNPQLHHWSCITDWAHRPVTLLLQEALICLSLMNAGNVIVIPMRFYSSHFYQWFSKQIQVSDIFSPITTDDAVLF